MTTHREQADTGEVFVTFELAGDVHDGIVSVVGSFNQWAPGVHVLELQEDGQRSVTVVVDADADVHFRYLGSGGVWFDDPRAETTEHGSIVRASEPQPAAAAGSSPEPDSPPPAAAAKRGRNRPTPQGK